MHDVKKLYRSRTNKIFLGILGGLGEYWEKDPTILRVLFIILLVFTGLAPFGLIYLLTYLVIPEEPS